MVFSTLSVEKRTMKKYLLLRDNHQSGPHTIEQMGSFGLHPLDLIWIENESTSWKYPEEIDELRELVFIDSKTESPQSSLGTERVFVSLPFDDDSVKQEQSVEEYSRPSLPDDVVPLQTIYTSSYHEVNASYSAHKKKQPVWQRQFFHSRNTATVIAVFVGVMIGSFIIKKWVDGYVPGYEETAAAFPVLDREVIKPPDENIHNALVTEIVPDYKAAPAKKTKKTSLRNQLKLSANNYNVGLFGGINGLRLTVFNTSSQPVDKVIVALDFLKRNGTVVESENIPFTSIKPKAAQTLSIPPTGRGVKLHFKIIKVYAHDYKEDLKEI
jgi:hypothetical protein